MFIGYNSLNQNHRMNKIPFFKSIKEELKIDLSLNDLKKLTTKKTDKKFFVKWLNENEFLISLNFSIGTNHAFDIDYKTKSAIVAYGTASELNENKSQVKLETKHKYGLLGILIIPIVMLILQMIFDLGIPVLFFFLPIVFFVIISLIFNSEEQKLIRYFKEYLKTEKINALQYY